MKKKRGFHGLGSCYLQIFRKMKLTVLALLLSIAGAWASSGYAQTARLTVEARNLSMEEFFRKIEDQSEYRFFYSVKVNVERIVEGSFENSLIADVLDEVLKNTDIIYEVKGKQIILSPSANPSTTEQKQKSVSGKVTDSSGATLPGVSVVIKGTTMGVITDIDGKYSISSVPENTTLQFSFVGMKTQEISVGGKATLNVKLEEETVGIEEVVAIGYGTVKKSDLTGSVSSFRKDDLNKGVNSTMTGLLQGKAAGVQITQASAEPGGGTTIQIRGAGSVNAGSGPLYVVDGLPIENSQVISGGGASMPEARVPRSPLSSINPADIESIEVLKDASATAIYGSRGANGVILVTTKKGSSGAMKITYSGYSGIQTPSNMIDVLNAEDYKRILNQILDTPGSNVSATERIGDIQSGGTNWQNELLRDAVVQSHSLSFTGGNNGTKYFASLNYFDQDGVLKTSGYKRYDTRLNIEHKANKMLFGVNFSTSYTHDNIVPVGFSTNEEGSALYGARGFDPTYSIYDSTGEYQTSSMLNLDNPLAMLYGKTSETDNYRTLGTVYGEYTILKGWTAKLNVGIDTT
jgi:TonB-linked SusC/RagA family outer membrane protein